MIFLAGTAFCIWVKYKWTSSSTPSVITTVWSTASAAAAATGDAESDAAAAEDGNAVGVDVPPASKSDSFACLAPRPASARPAAERSRLASDTTSGQC